MQEKLKFIIGLHADISAAEGDFDSVRRAYGANRVGTLDAAVIARKADGTERIYRHSAPFQPGSGAAGGEWGLASGLAVALFPSIWIGAGPPTLAAASEIGAIAMCVSQSLGRGALGDLGERLDAVDAALIVAAPETTAESARTAMTSPEATVSRGAVVDLDLVEAILAAGGAPAAPSGSRRARPPSSE